MKVKSFSCRVFNFMKAIYYTTSRYIKFSLMYKKIIYKISIFGYNVLVR